MRPSRATWTFAAVLSLVAAGCGNFLDLSDLHDRGAGADAASADSTADTAAAPETGHDAGMDVASESAADVTMDVVGDVTGDVTVDAPADVVGDVTGDADGATGEACAAGVSCVPTNACHTGRIDCTTGSAVCTDTGTSVTNGTSCGTNLFCDNGTCAACSDGATCTPTNQCHIGALSCTTGTGICNDTGGRVMNGASCGTNQVCLNGTCGSCTQGAACPPTANPCHNGTLDCSAGTPTCTDTGTVNSGANGATCGTNMVCNSGTCNACTTGAACTPINQCHVGAIACTTGAGVCGDTGTFLMNGASCGVNQVCLNGSCTSCTQGASCPPANPCHTGSLNCLTGTPTCNDTGGNLMNGTNCGTNMVCDLGSCNACTTGAVCTPTNICDNGSNVCTSGVPVCSDLGTGNGAANGVTCAVGKTCFNGGCDSPATLTLAPSSWTYPSTPSGMSSVDQSFTVQNTGGLVSGTITASLSGPNLTQFVISSNNCTTLAAGLTCTVKVHFSPTSAGATDTATLTVTANPGGSPTAGLSGTSPAANCGQLATDANTIALWHFDEGSGLTTADASGNGHTGTLGNSTTANAADPTWVTGRFAGALSYSSASSQYVQGAGSNTFPNNQVTVEFWEKAVSPYGSGSGGYSQPFTAGFIDCAVNVSSNDMEFGVGNGSSWSYPSAPTVVLTNGAWHYVTYVYDGVNQLFYVDGAKIAGVAASPATTMGAIAAGYGYQLGGRPANTFFNGIIDEMRISNVARTAAVISGYYSTASACP